MTEAIIDISTYNQKNNAKISHHPEPRDQEHRPLPSPDEKIEFYAGQEVHKDQIHPDQAYKKSWAGLTRRNIIGYTNPFTTATLHSSNKNLPTTTHAFGAGGNSCKGALVTFSRHSELKLVTISAHFSSGCDIARAEETHDMFTKIFGLPSSNGSPINYATLLDKAQDEIIAAGDFNYRFSSDKTDPIDQKTDQTRSLRCWLNFQSMSDPTYFGDHQNPDDLKELSPPKKNKKDPDGNYYCMGGRTDRIGSCFKSTQECLVADFTNKDISTEPSDHLKVTSTMKLESKSEHDRVKQWVKKIIEIATFNQEKEEDNDQTQKAIKAVINLDLEDEPNQQHLALIYDWYLRLAHLKFEAYTAACSQQDQPKKASGKAITLVDQLAKEANSLVCILLDKSKSFEVKNQKTSEFQASCSPLIKKATDDSDIKSCTKMMPVLKGVFLAVELFKSFLRWIKGSNKPLTKAIRHCGMTFSVHQPRPPAQASLQPTYSSVAA